MKRGPKPKNLKERFDDSYKKMPNGCWEWQKGLHRGYGQFWITPKERIGAHRMSYKLFVDENMPDWSIDAQINHKCHNPICVNPNHLYLGTQTENMKDRFERRTYEITKS